MKIEDFYRYVVVECPGAPDELLRQAIVQTAKDFCSRTHAWNEIQDPIDLVSDEADYDLEFQAGASPITVDKLWCGGRQLTAVTMAQIGNTLPDWRTATSTAPLYFNMANSLLSVRVFPTPKDPTEQLVLQVVFEPTLAATTLPDFLLDGHSELIATGAKGRLMLMHNKQWSNAPIGAAYRDAFDNGVVDERIKILHDRVPGTIRVQPRRFGA